MRKILFYSIVKYGLFFDDVIQYSCLYLSQFSIIYKEGKMQLEKLMNQFIKDDIYVDEFLKQINVLTKEEIAYIYSIKETTDMDKKMHGIFLVWLLKHQLIDLNQCENNPYLSYLHDLLDDETIVSVKFLTIQPTLLVAKIITSENQIYLFMNHSKKDISFHLPKEITNQTVFCLNCNDDMFLENDLDIPEYSFYAFKK